MCPLRGPRPQTRARDEGQEVEEGIAGGLFPGEVRTLEVSGIRPGRRSEAGEDLGSGGDGFRDAEPGAGARGLAQPPASDGEKPGSEVEGGDGPGRKSGPDPGIAQVIPIRPQASSSGEHGGDFQSASAQPGNRSPAGAEGGSPHEGNAAEGDAESQPRQGQNDLGGAVGGDFCPEPRKRGARFTSEGRRGAAEGYSTRRFWPGRGAGGGSLPTASGGMRYRGACPNPARPGQGMAGIREPG